jgi:Protein of unknown function (DUF3768)
MSEVRELTKGDRIRILNDHLRTTFTGGRIMLTAAVAALDPSLKARVLAAVREFKDFGADNDPHNEHDLAFFEVDGERYYWKIDYMDRNMEFGSDDPADPDRTTRILTVGHASDY